VVTIPIEVFEANVEKVDRDSIANNTFDYEMMMDSERVLLEKAEGVISEVNYALGQDEVDGLLVGRLLGIMRQQTELLKTMN